MTEHHVNEDDPQEPGSSGWVVPPCDKDALCDAIVRLANDANLRRRIGRQARADAEIHHGWKYTAEQLEQLFMKIGFESSC